MSKNPLLLLLILAISSGCASAQTQTGAPSPIISIVTDPAPGQAAEHGLEKIIAALKDKQVSFETAKTLDDAKGKMLIVAGLANVGGSAANLLKLSHKSVPTNADTLAIKKVYSKGS